MRASVSISDQKTGRTLKFFLFPIEVLPRIGETISFSSDDPNPVRYLGCVLDIQHVLDTRTGSQDITIVI